MSTDMKVMIFSVFLISFAVSGFVPKEPTKQDIDIARIEFSKLQKSSFKVVAAEDTTEDNNGEDDLGETIKKQIKNEPCAVKLTLIQTCLDNMSNDNFSRYCTISE